jgi:hypothetical protein
LIEILRLSNMTNSNVKSDRLATLLLFSNCCRLTHCEEDVSHLKRSIIFSIYIFLFSIELQMVLVDIKLEEQCECSVATTITMILQRVLMAWHYKAGCKRKSSHAFPKESKNKIYKLAIRWQILCLYWMRWILIETRAGQVRTFSSTSRVRVPQDDQTVSSAESVSLLVRCLHFEDLETRSSYKEI